MPGLSYFRSGVADKTKWGLEIGGIADIDIYRSRFQTEFLYRNGKRYTGLNDSQARSENRLHFHFNTSITSINIAKATNWLSIPK